MRSESDTLRRPWCMGHQGNQWNASAGHGHTNPPAPASGSRDPAEPMCLSKMDARSDNIVHLTRWRSSCKCYNG
jgi:hypothetical protein